MPLTTWQKALTLIAMSFLGMACYGLWLEISLYRQTGVYESVLTGAFIFSISPGVILVLQSILPDILWDEVVGPILEWPAWAVFGLPGIIFMAVAWKGRLIALAKHPG